MKEFQLDPKMRTMGGVFYPTGHVVIMFPRQADAESTGESLVTEGGFYVPLSQPLGNLVFAALEPDSPDSFFARRLITRLDAIGRVANLPTLRLEEY